MFQRVAQLNKSYGIRSSQGKKFWVSCRQLGEMTKNGLLIKSPSGQVQGDNDEAFIVKDQNVVSHLVHVVYKVPSTFYTRRVLLHDGNLPFGRQRFIIQSTIFTFIIHLLSLQISLTVSHFEANVTTTFIRPKRLLPLYEKQVSSSYYY